MAEAVVAVDFILEKMVYDRGIPNATQNPTPTSIAPSSSNVTKSHNKRARSSLISSLVECSNMGCMAIQKMNNLSHTPNNE
ncbi:hypothetical protein QJS04_geneDACA001028 [Acorus gramineus]|uniref:Uncharacterized protein n=1 Tax=Acorus gramineus TaxID=55184 RepID=A0AAV9AET7_ACOGR|nr:hypothetical protein QJS04_geneDACA001028 [Acorus gramineus]